ncbi:MAG: hypothetical protein G8D88_00890 [gamma proteobacterium symbiont of Ctena orbiculata]
MANNPNNLHKGQIPYIANFIGTQGFVKKMEFWADNDVDAWREAHKNIDPLGGRWVEVKRMTDSQIPLDLDSI